MGWLIGGGIAALLILLGKRQAPAAPVSASDATLFGGSPSSFARSGTSGPGLGITLGSAGVRGCCGTSPIGTLVQSVSERPLSQLRTYNALPAQTTVQLRPTTAPATPGVAPITTGRYITRLGVRLYA
jgi:hypothetical protein